MSRKLTFDDLPRCKALFTRQDAVMRAAAQMLVPESASFEQIVEGMRLMDSHIGELRELALRLEAEALEAKGLVTLRD